MKSSALDLRHTEGYLYALGRKHGGAQIDPLWFAATYESAKENWERSPGVTGKWIGVAAFFDRWVKEQAERAA